MWLALTTLAKSHALRVLGAAGTWIQLTAVAANASAADQPLLKAASLGSSSTLSADYLLKVSLGLFLVLCAFAAFVWLLRRVSGVQTAGVGQLRILGGLSLGPREKLVLVKVGKKQLLLGVCAASIQKIDELTEEFCDQALSTHPVGTSFAERLRSAVKARASR